MFEIMFAKIKRKIKKAIYRQLAPKELTPEEEAQRKRQEEYDYLVKNGVETELGYVTLHGLPVIRKYPGSRIKMGKNVVLISHPTVNLAGVNHPVIIATYSADAEVILEDKVGMSGASINCVSRCVFKEGTMLGANVNVWDTDFHPIDPEKRVYQTSVREAETAPITVGRNVWIGANSTVLKGVTIGDNTVVGTMSLVNKSLPANSVCAGIPAQKIRDL